MPLFAKKANPRLEFFRIAKGIELSSSNIETLFFFFCRLIECGWLDIDFKLTRKSSQTCCTTTTK
jgi:hypothetical protein